MTIGIKLTLSFGGMLALLGLMALSSLIAVHTLSEKLDLANGANFRKTTLAGEIGEANGYLRMAIRGELLGTFTHDQSQVAKEHQKFLRRYREIEADLTELQPLLTTEKGRRARASMRTSMQALEPLEVELSRLCAAGNVEAANQIRVQKTVPLATTISDEADQIRAIMKESSAKLAADSNSAISLGRTITFLLIGFSGVLAALVLLVIRKVNRQLRQIAVEIAQNAEELSGAASQVASSSQSLAQDSSSQAASLEETSAASEEINSMSLRNTANSRSAMELVTKSAQNFGEANASLEQMVIAMGGIRQSSDKVAKIIKIIDEIAFQTNILALNAAVEAARAGEAGMGFAVVADEVRTLAQRCANAARDTTVLIEESITNSSEGSMKVTNVASSIRTISEDAQTVKKLVEEVNTGSEEQTKGIQQIAKAITQMENVTQSSAASAEESAAAAEELSAQSECLNQLVHQLTVLVG